MPVRGLYLVGVLGVLMMPSCFKGDEELQRQIIELRASLDAKDKAAEKTQAEVAELQSKMQRSGNNSNASPGPSGSSEELARANVKIAELTKQLEAAKAQAASSATADASATPKIDMDALAAKLEEDLTRKAKQLRELVQKQTPSGRIDEISLKSIEYPPQLVTPFSSAITFNVSADGGQQLRLQFPVTADLGGSWKLPSPDDVQKAYKQAKDNPQGLASNNAAPPSAPASPSGTAGPSAPPQAPAAHGGGMRQVDGNTFAFDWGDTPGGAAAPRQPGFTQPQPPSRQPQPQPQPQRPAANTGGPSVISNFVPPGSGGASPSTGPGSSPAPGPGAPAAPSTPAAAPPPVMPVVGDRVIRFND